MAKVPFILCCLCAFLRDASAKLTNDQKASLLQAHNFYRASVSPSAADMQAMRWSDALSEIAQQTAEKCDFKTGFNGSQSVGENTLSAPASVTSSYGDLVETQWFAEFQSYDYGSGGCSTICSHYTQLVTSSYDQLGCAAAYCNPVRRLSGARIYNALFLVCKYGGFAKELNVKGLPYLSGSSCSSCPSNKPICSNRLCDEDGRYTNTVYDEDASSTPRRPQADMPIFAISTDTSTDVEVAPSIEPFATLKTATQASPKPCTMGFVATTLRLGVTPGASVVPTPATGQYSTTTLGVTSAPKAAAAVFPTPAQPQVPLKVKPNPLNAVVPPPPPLGVHAPIPNPPNPPLRKSLKTMSPRFGLNRRYKALKS